jgi:hypothetical protein
VAVQPDADREQVLAFRLAGHNLSRRLPPRSLLEAAGACGIQDSSPGSAALALNARVEGLTPTQIDRATRVDRTLVQLRSVRAVPYLFPSIDLPAFTIGLMPEGEESIRFFISGAAPALDKVGISAVEAVEWVAAELLDILDGRALPFRQLSSEVTGRLERRLSAEQLAAWRLPSWYGPDQSLGEAIVHFALCPIALKGLYCFVPREGNEACFVRTDQWFERPLPVVEPDVARAELLRRYLRCYGPSIAEHFGEWAGISPDDARRVWGLVDSKLVEAGLGNRRVWLHRDDLAALHSPPSAEGVRLLPPHDPSLNMRDRETLLPDWTLHRRLWRSVGNPGVVLAGGKIAGTWRPRKQGKRLVVTVEPLEALSQQVRAEIAAEAELMAPFRGCTSVEVAFAR